LAFHICLPPLGEQRRIVEKIQTLLAEVSATRAHIARGVATVSRFRQAVLVAAFSGHLSEDWRRNHPTIKVERAPVTTVESTSFDEALPNMPDIPETWSFVTVRDVAARIQYGCNAKARLDPGGGVPILRMGNIRDGRIDMTDLKYVNSDENAKGFSLQRGDLLFNRTNSPELVGKSAVYDRDDPAIFASYLVRIRAIPRVIRVELLCAWINSPWGRAWARVVRTDGVSQSNINATKVADMPVPLPPIEEQEEIARRVDALFTLADALDARIAASVASTRKLAQSILAKAFRGDLVPSEADLRNGLRSDKIVGQPAKPRRKGVRAA
jgi:type I restriction enzyme S subunit